MSLPSGIVFFGVFFFSLILIATTLAILSSCSVKSVTGISASEAVPGGLFQNYIFNFFCKSVFIVNELQYIISSVVSEAGLDFAVGEKADSVAIGAEFMRNGIDKTDSAFETAGGIV